MANQLVEQCVAAFLGPEPFLAFCAQQALLLAPPAPALHDWLTQTGAR